MKIPNKNHILIVVVLVISAVVVPKNAHAYLDPGTGSFLVQVVIASLLGASVVVKSYWFKISSFFRGIFGMHKKKQSTDNEEQRKDN